MSIAHEMELQYLRDQVASMRNGGSMLRNLIEQLRIAALDEDDFDEVKRILTEFFGE